jgi:hypothetical protein
MTSNFPGRTDSDKGPGYHTVPILVVFSLGENLNRRRHAERSEEFFRNLGKQSAANAEEPPKDTFNWASFFAKLNSVFAKVKAAVSIRSSSKHQGA